MNIKIDDVSLKVIDTLEKAGFEAYMVGGAVRDMMLGIKSPDLDFTTNAKPEEILPLFNEAFYDNNFGTVMIAGKHIKEQFNFHDDLIDDDEVIDITTYRSEHGYSDNRRPDKVEWGDSIEEDLKRRDFTINAMALKIEDNEVKLIDPFDGKEDIDKKVIKAVGDPEERFEEDALRMMRAIRIGTQLGFNIEEKTLEAIRKLHKNLEKISWERIGAETMKLMASENAAQGVEIMTDSKVMEVVMPEVLEGKDMPQAGHHIYDVYRHMIESLRACPSEDPVVKLATFLHDVAKPTTAKNRGEGKEITFYNHEVIGARTAKNIAKRLRLSKKDQEKIFTLVRWHMFNYDTEMTDAAIRRFIANVGKENIHDMMMLRIGDRIGGGSKATSWRLTELQKRIGEQLYEPISVSDLKVDGRDVMKILGINPGPKIGEILEQLFEEVIDDSSKNTREYLEKRIKEIA